MSWHPFDLRESADFSRLPNPRTAAGLLCWRVPRPTSISPRKRPSMANSYPDRNKLELDDVWSVGEGENDGKPIILRFRPALREIAGHPAFENRLVIAWDY